MKKILALLLAVIMVFALVACGSGDDTKTSASPSPSSSPADSGKDDAEKPTDAGTDDETSAPPVSAGRVGYYDDDVDHFARDSYTFSYCYTAPSALSDNMIDCFKRLSKTYNFTLNEMNGNNDSEAYIQGIEVEYNKGVDGMLIDCDPTIMNRVYELLNELEIPYVALFNPMADADGKILGPSVVIDQERAGRDTINWYADRYKEYWGDIDESKLALLVINFSTSPAFQSRADGANEAFTERFPKGTVLEADAVAGGSLNTETGYDLTSQFISAHPEFDHWIVFGVAEDLAQGATRYAETTAKPENILITNSGSNILPLEFESGYDGTSWKVCYAVSDISYAGPAVTGLVAICDGRATMEDLWPEYKREGDAAAGFIADPIMVTIDNWSNFKEEMWALYE